MTVPPATRRSKLLWLSGRNRYGLSDIRPRQARLPQGENAPNFRRLDGVPERRKHINPYPNGSFAEPGPRPKHIRQHAMRPFLARLSCLLMTGLAGMSAHAADIDGRWYAEFETRMGLQKYVYEFKSGDDGTITGNAEWQRMDQKGATALKDVKLSGDTLSFVEMMTIPDGSQISVTYTGKLSGDELKLTRAVGNVATEDLIAKRVTGKAGSGGSAAAGPQNAIAPGPFQPTWESLAQGYRCPDWFRDAKFGIWAHWTAQCVPEQGDWYARNMYIQGTRQYDYHVAHYGHPSTFGFMEIDNLWKAEHWDPEKLMQLYKRAGAKYFVALANHHDNFDTYDSKYQPWNSVNVGPKKDIVGTWARIARENGLRFGVSNHSSHAWHWFQPAYGHYVEGPYAFVPYDAATLTKADGKGKWWEGLDPKDLYCGLRIPMPSDLKTAKEAEEWHQKNDQWFETVPPNDNGYSEKWFLRAQDLVDKYHPDLLYLDDNELPLGQYGLDIAAHYYNANRAFHGGRLEAVLDAKYMKPEHRAAVVQDIERGVAEGISAAPWQTDTCIGSWHYERRLFDEHKYKTVAQVVHLLVDVVSKNGNLLLSVPLRGDGTIDDDELAFLGGMAKWMDVNGEAIFGSRPWVVYGEGPSTAEKAEAGQFGGARDVRTKPYTAEDIRFTTKGDAIYAILLDWPSDHGVVIKSFAVGSAETPARLGREVASVSLLGSAEKLPWQRDAAGLHVVLPAARPGSDAYSLKIALK